MSVEHCVGNAVLAINNLLYRYAELFDAGDLTGASALFEHADIIVGGAVIGHGSEAVHQMQASIVRIHEDGTPRTRHVISNPIIEFDDDISYAKVRSTYTAFQQVGRLPLAVIAVGRYIDEMARVEDQWRFTSRDYSHLDLCGDVTQHLLGG